MSLQARVAAWAGVGRTRVRAVRDGLSLVGAGALLLLALAAPGTDAHAYWVFDSAAPYAASIGELGHHDAFLYAPPAALFFLPFHLLSWPAFRVLWLVIGFAALAALTRSWALACVALYPIALQLSAGNVDLLLAVAIVAGFRYPAAWSVVLLTKVTPGVGLVWFAVRREWRALGIALGATAAIALVSFAVVPAWWPQWLDVLASNVTATPPSDAPHLPIPLVVRLAAAAVIVAWGARTSRAWTVPLAAAIALPSLWIAGLSMLTAIVPLARRSASDHAAAVVDVSSSAAT